MLPTDQVWYAERNLGVITSLDELGNPQKSGMSRKCRGNRFDAVIVSGGQKLEMTGLTGFGTDA